MCFYLTVAVPADHVERIGEVFGREFGCLDTNNPSVAAALPSGHVGRVIITNGCSCYLYGKVDDAQEADPAERLRRKYEKRGWSEAKIARAIEQQRRSARPPLTGLRDDVVERLQTLCRSVGSVAVLV